MSMKEGVDLKTYEEITGLPHWAIIEKRFDVGRKPGG
jgi:hypothetical protein